MDATSGESAGNDHSRGNWYILGISYWLFRRITKKIHFPIKSFAHSITHQFTAASLLITLMLGLLPLRGTRAATTVLYVKPGEVTMGTCTPWFTTCDLQYALTSAGSGSGSELWAAAGTYTPGSNRSDTFQLKNSVWIRGGFIYEINEIYQMVALANLAPLFLIFY